MLTLSSLVRNTARFMVFASVLCCAISPSLAEEGDVSWFAHNRVIMLEVGVMKQSYTENDPFALTNNGVLDSERGTLSHIQLASRWQAETIPLYLQAAISRNNGGTRYNGYLQAGNVLTPYADTTGNIMLDMSVRAGLPFAHSETVQSIPFVEFQSHQWERRLAQYTENFNHTSGLLGVQLQWRQKTDTTAHPWSLELEGAVGQMLAANMQAPAFGFSQTLGKRGLWQLASTVGYELTSKWRIYTNLTTRSFGYGQSAVQGGVLLPANQTQQTSLSVGLDWHY